VFTHSVALLGRMVSGSAYVRDTCTCDNKLVPVNSSNRVSLAASDTVPMSLGNFERSDVDRRFISYLKLNNLERRIA